MTKKIKVAVIISSLNVGGAESMVTQLVSSLEGHKVDIHLFVLCKKLNNQLDKYIEDKKVNVTYIDIQGRVSLSKYLKVEKELSLFKPDILHVHLDMVYSIIWAILHNVRVIFTIHSHPGRLHNLKFKILFKKLLRANRIILVGVSQTISTEAIKLFKISPHIVKTINNPVNINKFKCERKFNNSNLTYLNVARFHPIKNHRLLIESFYKLLDQVPNAKLLLVGTGDLQDEIITLVKTMGMESSVSFLGNVYNVESVLCKADVFVLSSDSEAMPMTVLEAMASGLPVVATNVGGLPDIINNNGILVDPHDCEGLTRAMHQLAEDKSERVIMSNESIKKIQEYDIKIIANKYQNLYLKYFNS